MPPFSWTPERLVGNVRLRVAFAICRRIYVLYAGSLLEVAAAGELESEPLHPYALGLLLAEPSVERRNADLAAMPGSVPTPDEVAGRCPFQPHCQWAAEICSAGDPRMREIEPGRFSACVRIKEIRAEMAHVRAASDEPGLPANAVPSGQRPLIRVEALVKRFGEGAPPALGGIALEVASGESVGIVGESGSGKTTLARCLVGLETPTTGRIIVDGLDASDYAH